MFIVELFIVYSKTVSVGALQHYAMNGQSEQATNSMQAPSRGQIPNQPQRNAPQAPSMQSPRPAPPQGQMMRGGSAPPQQTMQQRPPPPNQQRSQPNDM